MKGTTAGQKPKSQIPTPKSSSPWNPDQYARDRDERSQPYFDLLGLVRPRPGMRVVDLGCGTGELTQVLHQQLQAAETVGVDRSETMLARSEAYAGNGLRFERGDIAHFSAPDAFDLVFSNAALQWVDDHDHLLPRLTKALAPGGQLAVQVPANHDHISHLIAHQIAGEEPFRSALGGYIRTVPVLEPEAYAAMLDRLGFVEQHVRLQVYPHHLAAREDVVEWNKGTLLTDYQQRMPPDLYERFLTRYRERLFSALEDTRPFFYPFKRILFWGMLADRA